ncbi:MAG: phosphate acyltransferase PlsX [Verrucomicrobiota bacterium]|jgi:glycerol-3-phosphate acyltransferase PlsX
MRIALDAMGGDFAPQHMIAGAQLAMAEFDRIDTLFLVGDESRLKAEMQSLGFRDPRVEIVHCTEVVDMHDSAVKAIRQKKDSSISVATDLVKKGSAQAVVSAGHTGAAVAAATVKLRTLRGVERAAIGTPFPNLHGTCLLIDAGASVDSRPLHLFQQAIMGSVYMHRMFGIARPVVGLMSNGEEEGKGNEVTREVFEMLRATPGLNFRGNIEGRDLANAEVHVAVCDGFVGNILLKGSEGIAKAIMHLLKDAFTASLPRKILAGLLKPAMKKALHQMNYENYGGSPLLGINGVSIIAHGSSSPLAMKNAIRVAVENVQNAVSASIEEQIEHCRPVTSANP